MLTGADFRRMITGAYSAFLREHDYINRLNVFPVPDGDTGTNMLLTIRAVNRALAETNAEGIGQLSRRAADSAILGARGNSGVIMAQLLRGVARGLTGKETATSSEVGKAFQYGILYAYRAVARPVEGTILTVAKGIAKGARRAVRENRAFADILTEAIQAGNAELARTPELLPVLKAAGVVDAGGKGLIVLLAGCLEGLMGYYNGPEANFERALVFPGNEEHKLTHPYCVEFVIRDPSVDTSIIRRHLELLGESLVLADTAQVMKVHIHTAHPGEILEAALVWGTLHDIKIDNMADQHRWLASNAEKKNKLAVISVSPGAGLGEIMRQLGAEIIISGGQTMNPPVEEFVDAVHRGQAERYIILPNNSNIILAAVQAKKLVGDKVTVLATRNVSQGLAALVAFNPTDDIAENASRMMERCEKVRAAGITIAVRDSTSSGRHIAAGQYIGVVDNKVIVAGSELASVLSDLVKALVTAQSTLITLYYGVDLSVDQAETLAAGTAAQCPNLQVEVYSGGQSHYHFLISVE